MKLASPPPVVCSSCYGQYPQRQHVDFESAWDGPTFTEGLHQGDEVVTNLVVSVDDLVICEDCLREAGKLVGLGDVDTIQRDLEQLEQHAQELRERLAGQADYIDRLEKAAEARGRLSQELTGKVRAVTPQGPRKTTTKQKAVA